MQRNNSCKKGLGIEDWRLGIGASRGQGVELSSPLIPGADARADSDSPLVLSIAFCDKLYQPTVSYLVGLAGPKMPPVTATIPEQPAARPQPASFQPMRHLHDGIFVEAPKFDIKRYLQPPRQPVPGRLRLPRHQGTSVPCTLIPWSLPLFASDIDYPSGVHDPDVWC